MARTGVGSPRGRGIALSLAEMRAMLMYGDKCSIRGATNAFYAVITAVAGVNMRHAVAARRSI